jgi:membrane-associated phospholipid phosphatase
MLIDSLKMPSMFVTLGIFYTFLCVLFIVDSIIKGYWHGIVNNTFKIVLNNKIIFVFYVITILLIILFFDNSIFLWCKYHYNIHLYTFLDFFCSIGETWFIVGLSIAIMLIAKLLKANYISKVFELSSSIAIYSGLFNAIFKFILNRERPSIGGNPLNFFRFLTAAQPKLIDLTYAYNSMPSGHTITIASSLTVIFLAFENKIIKLICLFFMLMVPIARVYTLNHWFSDVFTSFVIGFLFGYVVYQTHLTRG